MLLLYKCTSLKHPNYVSKQSPTDSNAAAPVATSLDDFEDEYETALINVSWLIFSFFQSPTDSNAAAPVATSPDDFEDEYETAHFTTDFYIEESMPSAMSNSTPDRTIAELQVQLKVMKCIQVLYLVL